MNRFKMWRRTLTRIRVSKTIEAPKSVVWMELSSIERHVIWMKDAVRITFETDQRQGVGTTFRCLTRVGPFRTNDRMEITEWIEGRQITVHHSGLITGAGRFSLRGELGLHCVVRWEERLEFPWWLGGSIVAAAAKPILKSIWTRNLDRLAELIQRGLETARVEAMADGEDE